MSTSELLYLSDLLQSYSGITTQYFLDKLTFTHWPMHIVLKLLK